MRARPQCGFTIVELVAVCVILVILAGVVIPMVGGAIQGTKRARALGDLKAYLEAVKMVRRDTGEWPRYRRTSPDDFFVWSVPLSIVAALNVEDRATAGDNLQDPHFGLVGNMPSVVGTPPADYAHYENWHGPYMEKIPQSNNAKGRDPWGTPYLYIPPRLRSAGGGTGAEHLNHVGLLMSFGPNGLNETLPDPHWKERRFFGDDIGFYFSE